MLEENEKWYVREMELRRMLAEEWRNGTGGMDVSMELFAQVEKELNETNELAPT